MGLKPVNKTDAGDQIDSYSPQSINFMKFIVFSPPFDDNRGGPVVLHTLCHLINQAGYKAYIHPQCKPKHLSRGYHLFSQVRLALLKILGMLGIVERNRFLFRTCPNLNTPVIEPSWKNNFDDSIVIYPEIINGNPIGARRVIRWALHRPGFFSGEICYSKSDLFVDYSEYLSNFSIDGMNKLDKPLTIWWTANLEKYLSTPTKNKSGERRGSAYIIKKGKNKPLIHNLQNSICIDTLDHDEIIEIFDKVEVFYSYDPYCMFSNFAVLRGAISVVIPDEGVTEDDWFADETRRYGIGYGLHAFEYSTATRDKCAEKLRSAHSVTLADVSAFIRDSLSFFAERDAKK